MQLFLHLRRAAAGCAMAAMLMAQAPPRIYQLPPPAEAPKPEQAKPPAAVPAGPQTAAPAAQPRLADSRGFLLGGVSLAEMIDVLARMLKINYILDPRVKGSVTIYTYC